MDIPWLWNSLTSDWPATVRAIIGAGLGTILAQWVVPVLHDRRKRKAHAAYMAMRVAVVLEAYAAACSHTIMNNRNAEAPLGEEWPDWDTRLPALSPYPDDEEGWRALDRKLASKALDLRNRIHAGQEMISSTIEYVMEDLEIVLDEQMSARGLEAWAIASSLRRRHGVDMVDLIWDYANHLKGVAADVAVKKARAVERQEKRALRFARDTQKGFSQTVRT